MSVNFDKYHFTVSEYERMGETGFFPPDARVELIEGEIIEMSPIASPHAACVDVAASLLHEKLQRTAIIRVQNPIVLNDFSEPQPDISVLKPRSGSYRSAHPRPQDVLVVIEVSDTTLRFDRQVKVPLYARAGIPEVLIINLIDEQIEDHAQPAKGEYIVTRVFRRGEQFTSLVLPNVVLDVDEILGS